MTKKTNEKIQKIENLISNGLKWIILVEIRSINNTMNFNENDQNLIFSCFLDFVVHQQGAYMSRERKKKEKDEGCKTCILL